MGAGEGAFALPTGSLDGSPTHSQAASCQAQWMGQLLTWGEKHFIARDGKGSSREWRGWGGQSVEVGDHSAAHPTGPRLGHPVPSPPAHPGRAGSPVLKPLWEENNETARASSWGCCARPAR